MSRRAPRRSRNTSSNPKSSNAALVASPTSANWIQFCFTSFTLRYTTSSACANTQAALRRWWRDIPSLPIHWTRTIQGMNGNCLHWRVKCMILWKYLIPCSYQWPLSGLWGVFWFGDSYPIAMSNQFQGINPRWRRSMELGLVLIVDTRKFYFQVKVVQ